MSQRLIHTLASWLPGAGRNLPTVSQKNSKQAFQDTHESCPVNNEMAHHWPYFSVSVTLCKGAGLKCIAFVFLPQKLFLTLLFSYSLLYAQPTARSPVGFPMTGKVRLGWEWAQPQREHSPAAGDRAQHSLSALHLPHSGPSPESTWASTP